MVEPENFNKIGITSGNVVPDAEQKRAARSLDAHAVEPGIGCGQIHDVRQAIAGH